MQNPTDFPLEEVQTAEDEGQDDTCEENHRSRLIISAGTILLLDVEDVKEEYCRYQRKEDCASQMLQHDSERFFRVQHDTGLFRLLMEIMGAPANDGTQHEQKAQYPERTGEKTVEGKNDKDEEQQHHEWHNLESCVGEKTPYESKSSFHSMTH